jgi:hypothetical protein
MKAVLASVLFFVLAASTAQGAPPPWAQASPTAFHQTQTLSDGSTVTFTVSTTGVPAKGAGVDLGSNGKMVSPPGHPELKGHGGKFIDPTNPGRGLASVKRMSDCGDAAIWGRVDYDNWYTINLFTYISVVGWSYCNWTVQDIMGHWAWSESSCCGWDFQGNDTVSDTGAGDSNFQAFASATYQTCWVWWCNTESPWMILQGNGNGNETGFWWGV